MPTIPTYTITPRRKVYLTRHKEDIFIITNTNGVSIAECKTKAMANKIVKALNLLKSSNT